MAEEKKVYLPPLGPLVVKLPQEPIKEVLKHFRGRITPRTFAAAKRLQAKPGTLTVPTHLLRKLWELTGGWGAIEAEFRSYVKNSSCTTNLPSRTIGHEYSGYFERELPGQEKVPQNEQKKERVPWRNHAYGTELGELDLLFVATKIGPVAYLRWRGWVVGRIVPATYGDKRWLAPERVTEVWRNLGRRLTDEEADGWGLMTAEEVAAL